MAGGLQSAFLFREVIPLLGGSAFCVQGRLVVTSVRLSAVYMLGTGAVKYLLLGAALLLVPARSRAPAALHLVEHLQEPWTDIFSADYMEIIW